MEHISELIINYGWFAWDNFISICHTDRSDVILDTSIFMSNDQLDDKYDYLIDDFKRFIKLQTFL
jgi:hypothetical protein